MKDLDLLNHSMCQTVAMQCTGSHVRRASRAISQYFDSYLSEAGITGTQFTLLVSIFLHGEGMLSQVAESIGLDRTTFSRNLKPLQDDGLLRVFNGVDRRTKMVTLTARGKAVLTKALPLWNEAQNSFIQRMGNPAWQDFMKKLNAATVITQS